MNIKGCLYTTTIALCISMCGCVNISYLSPAGESFTYGRLGTQKITGFKIIKDKEGLISVEFASQEGTTGKVLSDIAEAIKNITALKVP